MAKVGTVTGTRRGMQDYKHVLSYFSAAQWAQLQSEGPDVSKLETMLHHAAVLGLRTPSEPALQILTCAWTIVSHGVELTSAMGLPVKRALLLRLKDAWQMMKRRLSPPKVWVPALPSDPDQFFQQYPGMAAAAWHGAAPVGSKIDIETIDALLPSFAMRDRGVLTR